MKLQNNNRGITAKKYLVQEVERKNRESSNHKRLPTKNQDQFLFH